MTFEEYKKEIEGWIERLGNGREIPESTINSWYESLAEHRKSEFLIVFEYFRDLDINQSRVPTA